VQDCGLGDLGFITGVTGGVFAYWFSFIEPATVFDIMIAVKAFVMMMLEGPGPYWVRDRRLPDRGDL